LKKAAGTNIKLKNKNKNMTYSSSLAASRQRYATKQQNITRATTQTRTLGPISNTIALLIMACILGLLYLTQVTKTNALSYELNDLRNQEAALKEEQNELQLDAARLLSVERAQNSEVATKLVTVTPQSTANN
jgi:hypothetical protein